MNSWCANGYIYRRGLRVAPADMTDEERALFRDEGSGTTPVPRGVSVAVAASWYVPGTCPRLFDVPGLGRVRSGEVAALVEAASVWGAARAIHARLRKLGYRVKPGPGAVIHVGAGTHAPCSE